MKVFISHSMKDKPFLDGINDVLLTYGFELLVAEHVVDLQNTISDKIKIMIEQCNVALILMTRNGINSGFVREEIGYINARQKPRLIDSI